MFQNAADTRSSSLLHIRDLSIHFKTYRGEVKAVRHVDLDIEPNEILGLVGESGCGKSVTARSILRLLPTPPAVIPNGSIRFKDQDLLAMPAEALRNIRGKEISMIFQEPMTSLNPVFRVGDQVAEAVLTHRSVSAHEAREKVLETLDAVGIPDPQRRYRQYPHQLSGGLRQRVMIAMALASEVSLLIADEPTTALDVTIQAQILDLMARATRDRGMSILMITHDLGVIAQLAHRVAVMYAGKIVEEAPVEELLDRPLHPYTKGLMASIPSVELPHTDSARLSTLKGTVPELLTVPKGCPFVDRCPHRMDRCAVEDPSLSVVDHRHRAACWLLTGARTA